MCDACRANAIVLAWKPHWSVLGLPLTLIDSHRKKFLVQSTSACPHHRATRAELNGHCTLLVDNPPRYRAPSVGEVFCCGCAVSLKEWESLPLGISHWLISASFSHILALRPQRQLLMRSNCELMQWCGASHALRSLSSY
jgi:hypothetical protein